jgi:hypothetical protein
MDDNETKDKIETNKKCPDTKKVISLFISYVDESTIYSLDEYKKLLSISYKEANKKQKKRSQVSKNTEISNGGEGTRGTEEAECEICVKREPSKYNIFVREEMSRLKETNNEIPYKELMKMAAKNWNERKNMS